MSIVAALKKIIIPKYYDVMGALECNYSQEEVSRSSGHLD